jgi:hypothetical protein
MCGPPLRLDHGQYSSSKLVGRRGDLSQQLTPPPISESLVGPGTGSEMALWRITYCISPEEGHRSRAEQSRAVCTDLPFMSSRACCPELGILVVPSPRGWLSLGAIAQPGPRDNGLLGPCKPDSDSGAGMQSRCQGRERALMYCTVLSGGKHARRKTSPAAGDQFPPFSFRAA